MPDIIHLLPDSVANQIAAGEVIQRPASAVKEMLENSIDAGAGAVKLIIKDAGKTGIQVIDDGCGMSETDARMCFERHATSKIQKADDLFAIRTMGFRGEALASIAAIAQVELKTRRTEDEVGTLIQIEGSEVVRQETCGCPAGTSVSIRNLFYNVPARRNFLKSNAVETRHIIEEFLRVSLAHPEVFFSLHHDGQEVFHFPKTSLKQRIIHAFGNQYAERLIPVEEDTSILRINGFAGKPGYAKKTRGDQYFFVNRRFIKDPYLNHAVLNAYEELLPDDTYPLYVLMIDIDPGHIDVNVHPTKTEIKFDDEKPLYAILRSAVKRSLGKFNISPSLDFEQDHKLLDFKTETKEIKVPTIQVDPDFNPFKSTEKPRSAEAAFNPGSWEQLYTITRSEQAPQDEPEQLLPSGEEKEDQPVQELRTYQIHNRYILSHIKSGMILIDQQAAHERVLYERYLDELENKQGTSQQNLFPQTVSLSPADFELVRELQDDIRALGFDFREFGKHTLVVEGTPSDIAQGNEEKAFEKLIENYKKNLSLLRLDKRDNLARSLARNASIKAGTRLDQEEMNRLIDELFACKMPRTGISGKPTFITISLEELIKRFERI